MTHPDHALDHVLHGLADALLDGLPLGLGQLAGRAGVTAARQGLAVLVDDHDAVRLHVRHRAGDEVLHRADLIGRRLAGADADRHRGGGLLRLVLEQLPAGHDQVHAGLGHPVQGADGARQLAFGGALHVQLLNEVGLAQRALGVENLVADRAGGGQALAGQHQAGGGDLVALDHDGRAVAFDLIFDVRLFEGLGDRPGLAQIEVGIQQAHGLDAQVQYDGGDEGGRAGADAEHHRQSSDTVSLQGVEKLIHVRKRLASLNKSAPPAF